MKKELLGPVRSVYNDVMVDHAIPWVVGDHESVVAEAEPYVGMAPEQRAVALAAACRAAMRLLGIRADRQRVLSHTDPLPESSIRALERLRREARQASAARP